MSDPAGDSVCPACGYLLWQFRDAVGPISGIPLDEITLSSLLREDLGVDSLAVVELVMELEDKGIVIADEDYMQFRTVRDVIEYLRRHPPEGHN
ncbi:MAG: acyl carrier protein [Planctomycetaceae bacterium]|nr:acyl carrier protein [Planctomycetaceae bacterium]